MVLSLWSFCGNYSLVNVALEAVWRESCSVFRFFCHILMALSCTGLVFVFWRICIVLSVYGYLWFVANLKTIFWTFCNLPICVSASEIVGIGGLSSMGNTRDLMKCNFILVCMLLNLYSLVSAHFAWMHLSFYIFVVTWIGNGRAKDFARCFTATLSDEHRALPSWALWRGHFLSRL